MNRTVMTAFLAMVVALGTLMVAGEGATAKGKPGSTAQTASITLNQGPVSLGSWVTFSYSGIDGVRSPRVQIMCYQDVNGNGVVSSTEDVDGNGFVDDVVYGMADAASSSFQLGGGSSAWKTRGGSADCTATLYEWDWHPTQTFVPYATTRFTAGG